MAGKKTSVWLGQAELDEWKASGFSLTDIVKRGLAVIRAEMGDPQPDLGAIQAEIRDLRDEVAALRRLIERAAGETNG
jgi:hypothetical protein